MFDAIEAAARHEATLLHLPDGRSWSYGDMLAFSGRLAARLVQRGVKPGDRVAAQVDKSAEALMLYLASLRAGAVFLPLNTAYTLFELDYFVGDARPRLLVVPPALREAAAPLAVRHGAQLETLDDKGGGSLIENLPNAEGFEDVARGSDDLAAILYTSGTTGRSKGAMLSHDNLLSNAQVLKDYWRFDRTDRLIHALPTYHTHGLFVATNVILLAGASMDFLPRFDPRQVLSLMPSATSMMGVPTFYVRLLELAELSRANTARMRLFVSGSAPLLADTHRQFEERTGHRILERYGMTETNMNTSNPYDGDRVAGTVGFPLPGIDLRIADPETGAVVSQGEIGVIEVRGPNVFKGYWRMPEKTAAEFRPDGFFITGDLASVDEHGYVTIVGRGKDLVISGGFNVYPKEVELAIDAIAGVVESAVIGLPHPDFGEGVTAVIVPEQGAVLDEAAVLKAIGSEMARYKHPKRVLFVDELPRNAMGKVQKNVLRDRYQTLYDQAPVQARVR